MEYVTEMYTARMKMAYVWVTRRGTENIPKGETVRKRRIFIVRNTKLLS